MKVYGWSGYRQGQVRLIVAAPSAAAAARAAGYQRPRQMFNLGETRNEAEVSTATSKPGAVFARPINAPDDEEYREVER